MQDLNESQYRLFLFLQMAITAYAPSAIPALTDRDVTDAARAMADTLDTAARGIIYAHQVASIPAQRLMAELNTSLETLRKDGRGPRDADVALALKTTAQGAAGAAAALGGGRTYLDLLGSLFQAAPGAGRERPEAAPPSSGLILP